MNVNYAERYEIRGLIGRGGLAEVLLAMDVNLNRLVAIKRLHHLEDTSGDLAEDAIREARTLAALMHPNIVTIFDVFPHDRDVLVAMEYVRGRTLQAVGEYAPVIVADFLEVAAQSLRALSAAHEQGILHRDVKPGNIMVMGSRRHGLTVKVVDFGLAALAESVRGRSDEDEVVGSIFTMAPEQLERMGEDERTDLYSLGCVLYFILAGRYPFQGADVNDVINAHLDHQVVPIATVRPDLPEPLGRWLMRLLARSRDERPASALDALDGLADVGAV